MNVNWLKSELLNHFTDGLTLSEFEGQVMVDMPFAFSDEDVVSLMVFPFGTGYKVTDGGDTELRLSLRGIDVSSGAAGAFWKSVTSFPSQKNMAPEGDEIAVVVHQDEVAKALVDVAFRCIHAEHASLKAPPDRIDRLSERVGSRIKDFIRQGDYADASWDKNKEVTLKSGRKRPITGIFRAQQFDEEPLMVQAIGGQTTRDRNEPADRAFSIFSNLAVPKENKLVVAEGERSSWEAGIIQELNQIASTVFFEEPAQLESVLAKHIQKGHRLV